MGVILASFGCAGACRAAAFEESGMEEQRIRHMTLASGSPLKNRLLAALPQTALDHLGPHLASVSLSPRQVLYKPNAPIELIYFPEQGVVSVLTVMSDGTMGEVGMIGTEGMAGAPLLLGTDISAQHVVVQVPGTALTIAAAPCRAAFAQQPAFHNVVLRFVDAFLNLGAQTAACNLHHTAEQRLARWLLMAWQRTRVETMPMTHEFLSAMLGVRRTGITAIAGGLQRAGLIHYHRGRVRITDHTGLEAAACECYRIDRERLARPLRDCPMKN
jgi:CRP-like cAMP-binding protein